MSEYSEGASSSSNPCKICEQNPSKYCCPRCNILYCSMACYKSELHLQCSESFFKECISEEIGCMEPDLQSKKKMMEILTKMHNDDDSSFDNPESMMQMLNEAFGGTSESEGNFSGGINQNYGLDFDDDERDSDDKDSDDCDSVIDLAERMKDVDLENADEVWKLLTDDEKNEFGSLVSSGDWRTKILPSWEPWWNYHKEKKLIEEIGGSKLVKSEVDYRSACPPLLMKVKDFADISKQKPAFCVKYNLLNLLCSYVYTVRLFNGDHHSFSLEAACVLTSICANIKYGCNFDDAESAVDSVLQECNNNTLISPDNEAQDVMKQDVKNLLKGPEETNKNFYINCALSDIHNLLNTVKKLSKTGKENLENNEKSEFFKKFPDYQMANLKNMPKEKIKLTALKVEYFLSYLKDFGVDMTASANGSLSLVF